MVDTCSIEFLVTPVRLSIHPRFINKTNKCAISNSNAAWKSLCPHLLLQKSVMFMSWPSKMVISYIVKCTTNLFGISMYTSFRDRYHTCQFYTTLHTSGTQQTCKLVLNRPLWLFASRNKYGVIFNEQM